MNKKPLSILPIAILSFVIIAAIGYTISQFYNVEKRLTYNTEEIFHKTVYASYDIIDTTVNESLKSYLHGIAFSISKMLDTTEKLPLNQARLNQTFKAFVNQTRVGEGGYISIVSPAGKLIFHPYAAGKDISERDFIQQQLSHDETFLEYDWQNPGEKEKRQKVAYSMKLDDGFVINISVYKDEMMNLIDKEAMTQKLKNYNFRKTGYVYVVDRKGNFVLHPTSEGKPIRSLIGDSADEFMRKAHEKSEGRFTYPLLMPDGSTVTKTVAYKYYPYLDWIIASGISQDELTKPTDLLWHGLAMAVICLLLIIAGLTYGLNSRHKRILMIERKDFLTGLNNRRCVMEYTKILEQKEGLPYSVIILDIDKFKTINDTYGHGEGDLVILATAKVLKAFEYSKIIVSRHGGEEFLILMENMNVQQAYLLAEIIRQRVSEISHLQSNFTISAGVYESYIGKEKISEAVSHADHALYRAKETGRNRTVIYQPEFD
ncbi:diguanylate cyclase [Vibrio sp. CK2-1]|uniref:diguanylate cyclase domain-containing protein n=1 Tax=Vibrio sp. CK2-1 TaxID=2912249 RepID=UPI001F416B05|nr:diguanylate cyclase [Vibrio sp. CK2-1]MCF7354607.1 diguanylate cyclase [Vibrio sp. CK2-1]